MKLYKRKIYFFKKNSLFDNLLNSLIPILLINWFLQGIRGMGFSEFLFRILFETILIIFFYFVIEFNLFFSLIISHTVLWIFFYQFWCIIRYFPFYNNDIKKMNKICKKLIRKIQRSEYLDEAAIIGSISRQKHIRIEKMRSDLDIKIFISNRFLSFFTTNFFMYYLRFYSFFVKFPLDINVYDNFNVFKKIAKKDKILIILDKKNKIHNYLKRNEIKF